jgi:CRP-like cAMP-binding protein
MRVAAETLRVITAFKDLDIEERQRLAATMGIRRYAPGESVIAQDDDSSEVFFVVSGQVRATQFSTSGKEVDFQDLGPGDMFGELSAIDGEPRSTHVVALSDSLIATMSKEAFWAALLGYPSVARHTLRRLTGLVRLHCERIFEYSTLGVKNRIHAELLRLARDIAPDQDGEVVIPDPPTHAEIASRVATHREAVTRECKHMEALGLIEWRRGHHVIKDVAALERMVKEVRGH